MFTISKWGLAYTEPIFFVAVRMLVAGALLCGFLLIRGMRFDRALVRATLIDWFLFIQIIFFHIYLTYICDLCALKNISSIESAVIYNLSPFIAAVFSYFWFNERMTPKKWFGLLLGFSAFIPALILQGATVDLFTNLGPRLLTLIAVISSAYGWIVLRALVQKGYSPLYINGIGMTCAGVISLFTSYFAETWDPSPVTQWIPFIQATVLIVVFANIIFYNLYGYLLKRYTATFLAFAGFLCPLFAALLGYLFLHETVSWYLIFSFVLVLIGLMIFYHEELRQGYIKGF